MYFRIENNHMCTVILFCLSYEIFFKTEVLLWDFQYGFGLLSYVL